MNKGIRFFHPKATVEERLAYFDRARPNRKYAKGKHPCGNCMDSGHERCRPRQDGQLCSCNCPRATEFREEFEAEQLSTEFHRLNGEDVPEKTVAEVAAQCGFRLPKEAAKKTTSITKQITVLRKDIERRDQLAWMQRGTNRTLHDSRTNELRAKLASLRAEQKTM